MKKTYIVLTSVLVTLCMHLSVRQSIAQAPDKMSYQAVVRNSGGTLVSNQNIGMKVSILQGSPTGTLVYQEVYNPNPQTNANGLVTVEIGGGTSLIGTFSTIDWSAGPYFLKTETDPGGGTNYTISGTSQLLSVPYALNAKNAENYTETDPQFALSSASGISGTNIGNWNTAYGWSNHALAGYIPGNRTLTINGTDYDLSSNRTWNVGTVTSVALSMPAIFSVSGSPVTTIGTLSASLVSQSANLVLASPSGTAGIPLFRTLDATDIPNLDWNKIVTGKPTTLGGYGITDGVNTTGNQTIAGNKTFIGTTTVPTPVNETDAATKSYVDNLESNITALENKFINMGLLVRDIDGNVYATVKIGTQVWMAENLKVTKFNDGTPIPNVTDDAEWKALGLNYLPAYCWYNNDAGYKDTYGGLYSRGAVFYESGKNVCPVGWHVPPTSNDWMIMFSYLNPELEPWWNPDFIENIGNKLKEAGSSHWNCIENASTNETGFTALPGGMRRVEEFSGIGNVGIYWADGGYAMYAFVCNSGTISNSEGGSEAGFSVRCVKD